MQHTRYAIVIERATNNYGAYAPDLPGVVATGKTIDETKQLMSEAIAFHLEGMREENLPIPQPTSIVADVEVAA